MSSISPTRARIFQTMETYSQQLQPKGWKILEIGTDGDPEDPTGRPAGNYRYFGEGNDYKTMDVLEKCKPDYLEDIVKTKIKNETFDLIICSQVLEHIWEYEHAIYQMWRILKDKGYLILDTPWMYPYHPEPETPDYWRFSQDAYHRMLSEFRNVEVIQFNELTSALCRK
jgi:SAM-dependent methyltransferase